MKKILYLLIAVIVFFTYSCKNGNKQKDEKEVMKIGVITPLTGEVASWGEIQKDATNLAIEKINKTGGINNKKVKVIFEDSKASPKEGVAAFKKLYEADNVDIVVGVPASNVTLAIAPVANKMKKVLLTSGSTATEVGNAGPYIFRIMPSDEEQALVMSKWAFKLGYKKIAIIYVENSWGTGLLIKFEENYSKLGGEITAIESTKQDASDFRTQLLNIKNSKPDAIYAPLYTRNAGLMIRQAREMGIDLQILGADVYNTPDLIASGGEAVNGVLYTQFSQGENVLFKEFEKEYELKYNKKPETYAGYCYDVIFIALEALKGNEDIRKELLNINEFRGVTGLTSFNGKTSATGKTFEKWTVKNGYHKNIQ